MNHNAEPKEESAESGKPWSSQKIREKSASWSLAGDAGLLLQLEKFSETLMTTAHETHRNISTLIRDSKAAHSRINNSVNSFLMLANNQFLENRVYDEEISEEAGSTVKTEEQEKSKEERELELVSRFSLALELALRVVDQAFDKHEIVDSESEDEGGRSCLAMPVLEPKDPYSHRPLPYIIGSEKFLQDDRIGLIDLFSEEEGEESENESLSESYKSTTAEKKPVEFVETSDVESDSSTEWKEKRAPVAQDIDWEKNDSLQSDEDNMFSSRSVDGESLNEQNHLPSKQAFADEIARKLTSQNKQEKLKDNDNDAAEPDVQEDLISPNSMRNRNDEFGSSDINHEDDELFTKHSSLFSSETAGGLFDEGDDQEDLFSDLIKKEILNKPKQKEKSTSSVSPAKKTEKKMSIFDDNDDDIFADTSHAKDKNSKIKADETEEESVDITPKRSLPAGAVSLFGNAVNPLTAAIKARCVVEADSDNQDEWSDSDKGKTSSAVVTSSNNVSTTNGGWLDGTNGSVTSSMSSASLFAEEPEAGDIFNNAAKKPSFSIGGVSLFDDDMEVDDDDLFGSTSILRRESFLSTKSLETQKKSLIKPSVKSKTEEGVASDSNEKHVPLKLPQNRENQKRDDAAGSKTKHSPPKKIFLFDDDDDDDDDDIFSEPKSKTPNKPSRGSSGALFVDDDFLGGQDNASSVDLFKPLVGTPKSQATGKPPVPTPRKPSESRKEKSEHRAVGAENFKTSGVEKIPSPVQKITPSIPEAQLPERILGKMEGDVKLEAPRPIEAKSTKLEPEGMPGLNMLPCVTKVRAKIPTKRRLPSRRGRPHSNLLNENTKEVASADGVDSSTPHFLEEKIVDNDVETNSASETTPTSKPTNGTMIASVTSPSTEEDDIFSLSDSLLVPVMKSRPSDKLGELDVPTDTSASRLLQKTGASSEDDALFTGSTFPPSPETKEISNSTKSSRTTSGEKKKEKPSKGLFDDDSDSDDLFASVSTWKTKQASTSSKMSQDSSKKKPSFLFGDSDDDDLDIFGSGKSNAH